MLLKNTNAQAGKTTKTIRHDIYCLIIVHSHSGSFDDAMDMAKLISNIQNQVQENQRKALIVSPVSLIASIILYGRATGGVSFGRSIITHMSRTCF